MGSKTISNSTTAHHNIKLVTKSKLSLDHKHITRYLRLKSDTCNPWETTLPVKSCAPLFFAHVCAPLESQANQQKNAYHKANLKAPIIWIFVRVISDFELLFLKFWTTSTVAFANKSSDKLEAREAKGKTICQVQSTIQFTKQNKENLHLISQYQFPQVWTIVVC